MSSNEDNDDQERQEVKKRKLQRACDMCRKKKIRCEGIQTPDGKCSSCAAYNFDCTYAEVAKKRGLPKGYVEKLEKRVDRYDKLLKRLCPDPMVYEQLTASLDDDSVEELANSLLQPPPLPLKLDSQRPFLDTVAAALHQLPPSDESNDVAEEDDEDTLVLSDRVRQLQLDGQDNRFLGRSSGAMLVQCAIKTKAECTGKGLYELPIQNHRARFWCLSPWEKAMAQPAVQYTYPDADLALKLIDHYFDNMNLYLPLLHRPTFEKNLAEGLHLTNASFAHVYLLVCAVGSRWSTDRRVLLDGEDSWLSSGWKWFQQAEVAKKRYLATTTLYDIQYCCLCVQYLQGCSIPQATWTVAGFGIRLAQDIGAHRRKTHKHGITAEDELLKRAFWILTCMDRMVSATLGRPCAIQDEDFDLDLPIDCDDEYWDHPDPEKRFKQPPNKPSKVTAFILCVKLNQILAFSLRTLYSIDKSKILLGFSRHQWEQNIVAELDSALNQWVDSMPDHLRWDPSRENADFFKQSATLYSAYYHIQILIHRPFIPSSRNKLLAFPSLAICTNASRSVSRVLDVLMKRNFFPAAHIHMIAFTAALVLLLSIWGGKRSGVFTDPEKEMGDVRKCMEILRHVEQRWHSAGKLRDLIYELASASDLPLPRPSSVANNKRERGSETPMSSAGPSSSSSPESLLSTLGEPANRAIAGSRRLGKSVASVAPSPSTSTSALPARAINVSGTPEPLAYSSASNMQFEDAFHLPVRTDDLRSIPVHGTLSFTANLAPMHAPHASDNRSSAQSRSHLALAHEHMLQFWAHQQLQNQVAGAHSGPPVPPAGAGSFQSQSDQPGSTNMGLDGMCPNLFESDSMPPGSLGGLRQLPMMGSTDGAAGMFDTTATGFPHSGSLGFFPDGMATSSTAQYQTQPPIQPGAMDTLADGIPTPGFGAHQYPGAMPTYPPSQQTQASGQLYNPHHLFSSQSTGASSQPTAGSVDRTVPQMDAQNSSNQAFVDDEVMAMWSNAPFALEQWEAFLNGTG